MPQGSGPIALFRFIDYSESDDGRASEVLEFANLEKNRF